MPSATAVALSSSLILCAAMPRRVTASIGVALQRARERPGHESVARGAGVEAVVEVSSVRSRPLDRSTSVAPSAFATRAYGGVERRDGGPHLRLRHDRQGARHRVGRRVGQARPVGRQPLDGRDVADQHLRPPAPPELVHEP